MAGVAQSFPDPLPVSSGAFSPMARAQYAALARMRWSMFRNGMRSTRGALESGAHVVTVIFSSIMGLAIAAGFGSGAYAIAVNARWELLPILFWGLFVLWQLVPISLASFQQQFDTDNLLRFPVSFSAFYLLHLVFGLVDTSTIIGGFCCLGVWTGILIARPDLAGWMALALLAFAAFNVLLVRAIFAWIDRWLAQRKTREIVTAIFFFAMLCLQLLNPGLRQHSRNGKMSAETRATGIRWLRTADAVQRWLPPGLAALAVQNAESSSPLQSLESLAALGLFGIAAGATLGARLRAEFRGENLGDAPARKKVERRRGQWLIDGSGPIAAVMEKELRTLMRAMPLLYSIGAPLLMVFVFSSIYRNGRSASTHLTYALLFSLAYAFVGFTQLLYNNLGGEGPGIQLLFLSPTPVRTVMLAKNFFHALLFALDGLLVCVVAVWRFGVPAPAALAASLAWVLFALPVHLAAGNVFSLTMAYRVNLGRIGRQKGSQANALLSLLVQAGTLGVGAAVLFLCSLWDRPWMAVPVFLVLAAAACFGWMRVLNIVDRLANERRDDLIGTLAKAE